MIPATAANCPHPNEITTLFQIISRFAGKELKESDIISVSVRVAPVHDHYFNPHDINESWPNMLIKRQLTNEFSLSSVSDVNKLITYLHSDRDKMYYRAVSSVYLTAVKHKNGEAREVVASCQPLLMKWPN